MIGIFGGTFDPVHYGHIKPALSVMQALGLSQLRFIPNRFPPHREAPWLSVEQRLALLQTALKEYPEAIVDERELNRDGPSYMVETLASLRKEFGDESLCLIIGVDVYLEFTSWYQWRSILGLCHLVVTTRPGFNLEGLDLEGFDIADFNKDKMLEKSNAGKMDLEDYAFLAEKMTTDVSILTSQTAGAILLQSVPQLDISSTIIRQKFLNGDDVSEYMPAAVCQQLRGFINDNR